MYGITEEGAEYFGQEASDLVRNELASTRPSMICRFGSTELNVVIGYCHPPSLKNYWKYLNSQISVVGYSPNTIKNITVNAGFFPGERKYLAEFAKLTMDDMKYIDILGSCVRQEVFFAPLLKHCKKIAMRDMEPFYHKDPWTTVLEGKKVLVVHPFEQSIICQYQKRDRLFQDPRFLPKFELKTIKAVQSIAKTQTGFRTWFEALAFMKQQIDRCDFDIAILGCGAYGVPLAAHIKRIGKKAIHIGGATQVLFGIRGSRWEEREFYRNLMNEHWIKPLAEDYPPGYKMVENGCYW